MNEEDKEVMEAVLDVMFPVGRSDVGRDHSRETTPKKAIELTINVTKERHQKEMDEAIDIIRTYMMICKDLSSFYIDEAEERASAILTKHTEKGE